MWVQLLTSLFCLPYKEILLFLLIIRIWLMPFNLSFLPTEPKSSKQMGLGRDQTKVKTVNKPGFGPGLTLNGPKPCSILSLHNLSPPIGKRC